MAYDGWLQYGDTELVNLSRTAQLSEMLGIDAMYVRSEEVQWIEETLGGVDYDDISEAPWYDPTYLPSTEFAGLVPLSIPALDDDSRTADSVEYITDGGAAVGSRKSTVPIVASVAILASTDRGAEFGKRWLDRVLGVRRSAGCADGNILTYFRSAETGSPKAHRRRVSLTRGAVITRKTRGDCSTVWWVSFTITDNDSYEYGEAEEMVTGLGAAVPTGSEILSYGSVALTEEPCPVYDYTPIFDPLYPALIEPPMPPDFYPDGWDLAEGYTFTRFWARVPALDPRTMGTVPVLTLTTGTDARMVRVSVWPAENAPEDQCGALFSAIVTYLPSGYEFTIDGEQRVSYVWDGASPLVRRTDSLVWGPEARPVDWTTLLDTDTLLVSLDIFSESGEVEGGGQVRAALSLVPKSD